MTKLQIAADLQSEMTNPQETTISIVSKYMQTAKDDKIKLIYLIQGSTSLERFN